MTAHYRTALPSGRLAGSIAALQLRERGASEGRPPPREASLLVSRVVNRAIECGCSRLELDLTIGERMRIELRDEGRGYLTFAVRDPDLAGALDWASSWGYTSHSDGTGDVLWFEINPALVAA